MSIKIRLHYFILYCLVKILPNLFQRYYTEYNEIYQKYRWYTMVLKNQNSKGTTSMDTVICIYCGNEFESYERTCLNCGTTNNEQ